MCLLHYQGTMCSAALGLSCQMLYHCKLVVVVTRVLRNYALKNSKEFCKERSQIFIMMLHSSCDTLCPHLWLD